MDDPDIGLDHFNELDTEFHVAIAESVGNRLFADLTVAIRESIRVRLPEMTHISVISAKPAIVGECRTTRS